MMVCMAGLQVFIVRFFFQVCSATRIGLALGTTTDMCNREQGRDTCELSTRKLECF
jgi:hypothetical protein